MAKKHNPFAMFRRNQKAWLAGLTLFTMFSFIVLGSLLQCVQSGVRQGEGTVVTYAKTKKFGEFDQYDFAKYRSGINQLNEFLVSATSRLMEEKVVMNYGEMLFVTEPDPNDATKQIPILLDNLTSLMQHLSYILSDSQALVDHWLVTKIAESRKYKADESGVRQYLTVLFQDKLTPDDLTFALSRSGLNEYFLAELIKNQLIYDRLIRSIDGGRRTASFFEQALPFGHGNILTAPGEVLDSCEKLYRKVRADVAVFKAEDYLDQVADPSEKTLKKFFEEYKNLPYSQYSETPGFYLPTKVALQVIRADVTEDRINAISAEEARAYYDAHKEEYKKPPAQENSPAGSDALSLPFDDSNLFGDGLDAPAIDLNQPTDDATTENEVPAAEEAPALTENEAPAAEEAPAPTENEAPAAEEAPAPTENEAPAAEEAPAPTENEAPAAEEAPAPTENEAPAAEEAPAPTENEVPAAEEAPAPTENEAPAAEEAPAPTENEAPAAEEAPAPTEGENNSEDETTATENQSAFRLVSYQEETETPAPVETATETPAAAETATDDDGYFSFETVEGEIRRRLAAEKLQAEIDAIFDELQTYAKTLSNIRANVSKKTDLKEVDMRQTAADRGFDFIETTQKEGDQTKPMLLSYEEARLIDILPESALQEVYASVPAAFSPKKTAVVDDSIYVYRASEVKAEHLPEFDEAKDLVLETWKIQEAAKLAMKDGQALAEKVRSEKKPLSEVVQSETKPVQFVSTQKFSWFDFSRSFRNPSLEFGEIREEGVAYGEADKKNQAILAPGKSFFEKAYELDVNGVDAIYNQPKNRVFVLQVVEKDSDEAIMSQIDNISTDQFGNQALLQATQMKNYEFHEDWIESLRKEAGFEWIVIPRELNN